MSKINIDGIVKEIKTRSNTLTPVIEGICNSIDAIHPDSQDGKIDIIVRRSPQKLIDFEDGRAMPEIIAIDIIDNGEGFTQENRDSFDTYLSGLKINQGGRGFGRFMFLKYFNSVKIESVFKTENGEFFQRSFTFGHGDEIIENEEIKKIENTDGCHTGTILHLEEIKTKDLDKGLEVIARKLVEKLLCFFALGDDNIPQITIKEGDGSNSIVLNQYVGSSSEICQIGETQHLTIPGKNGKYNFTVKTYKIYFSQITNKICLTAHFREVLEAPLHNFVPEFKETMTEITPDGTQKNFMVKVYVQGDYLDDNVSTDRESFLFGKDEDTLSELSEYAIYSRAAKIAKSLFSADIENRFKHKKQRVEHYVFSQAPWNKPLLKDLDLESIPVGISDFDLEMLFQKLKFKKEQESSKAIQEILEENSEDEDKKEISQEEVNRIVSLITEGQKSDLVHYVCQRKSIVDLFNNLRRRLENGKAHLESEMHNVIFPMIKTDRDIPYEEHNLWLLDERFNFTQFIASDKVISKVDHKEPDLALFYEECKCYRNGQNIMTTPIAIVEFKRPKRTDYPDDENPISQALRYAKKIVEGKYEMPDGIEPISANPLHTPVYIYIICDLAPKIKEFASLTSLCQTPDGEGFFGYVAPYNAYVEIKSYKKVAEDAMMRNKIFFHKLGLEWSTTHRLKNGGLVKAHISLEVGLHKSHVSYMAHLQKPRG